MTQNSDYVLSGELLNKTFDDGTLHTEVLSDIDIKIKHGEMLAIIGPSGSGKSTLLHLLGGLDVSTSGKVKICGVDINRLSESERGKIRNKSLGFIYQFHHLLPEFDALENVAMPLLIGGEKISSAKFKACEMLDLVGLSLRKKHRIFELSGGERQRVAIARALVTHPACVLADEPTGNLDHKTATQIYDLICKLNIELGIAFVVVTHDLSWAAKIGRVLSLENGKLLHKKID